MSDAWLHAQERAYEDRQAAYETADEAFRESGDYMPNLIEWLLEELKSLGKIPVITEECDCTLDQELLDEITAAFEDSERYATCVDAVIDEMSEQPIRGSVGWDDE